MPIARAPQGILGGIFGGGGGGVGLSLTNTGGLYANGGMFGANDNIAQFARGGAFTNQIVETARRYSGSQRRRDELRLDGRYA